MPPFLKRLPLWAFYPVGVVLLFGGLAVIGTILGPAANEAKPPPLKDAPQWMVALLMIIVGAGEALLWTVAFTEAFARVLRRPVLGAVIGVLAYGPLFHASHGALGVAASSWIGIVLAAEYLAMRDRSRRAAILNAVCLKWIFMAYAFAAIVWEWKPLG